MQKMMDALKARGFDAPVSLNAGIVRFDRNGKQQNAWFVGRTLEGPKGPLVVATFGDWATGEKHEWRSDEDETYTPEEMQRLQAELTKHKQELLKLREAEQKAAAERAAHIYAGSSPLGGTASTAYLNNKGIGPGALARRSLNDTVIPVFEPGAGDLVSLQFIHEDGSKKFLPGGRLKGCFSWATHEDKAPPAIGEQLELVYMAEGYATAMSVLEAEQAFPVLVAFNTGNMVELAKNMPVRPKRVCIAADNDHRTKGNPGLAAAMKAKKELERLGIEVWVKAPSFAKDNAGTDWNDLTSAGPAAKELAREILTTPGDSLPEPAAPTPPGQGDGGGASPETQTGVAPAPTVGIEQLEDVSFTPLPWKQGPKGPRPPSQTEIANVLIDSWEHLLMREGENVFTWRGTHWEEQERKNFKRLVRSRAERLHGPGVKSGFLDDCYNLLLDRLPVIPHGMSFYQQLPNISNFQDGTLEITRDKKTGEYSLAFRAHSRTDFCTWVLPWEYRSSRTPNPLFREWLDRCFQGDPDAKGKIRALKQLGGACLISNFPRIAFLYGGPGTGKSTFAKLCMRFMGRGNYASVPPKEQKDTFGKQPMINKQANIVTDISDERIDPAAWKRVEDRVPEYINRKGVDAVFGYLPALHLYCGNTLPRGIDGATEAFDRRVTIIEFPNPVAGLTGAGAPGYTRDYEEMILEKGAGDVLRFFLEGLEDLCASGGLYFNPESGAGALKAWKKENNSVALFLEAVAGGGVAGVKLHGDASISAYEAFQKYQKWCLEYRKPGVFGRNSFYDYVRKQGFGVVPDQDNKLEIRGFGVLGRANTGTPGGTPEENF